MNRMNFTSRMVITPLDWSYSIDDVVLPYHTAIELLKPQIIRRVCKIKKVSLITANEIWDEAALTFDPVIYKIMCELINDENIGILINRNPTIVGCDFGLKILA